MSHIIKYACLTGLRPAEAVEDKSSLFGRTLYNIFTKKHVYTPRLDPPSFGGCEREDAPPVVPVPANRGGEWIEMQELRSKKSRATIPETRKLEVKEKTHWNMDVSIGNGALEYPYEMENSNLFSIKLTFPAGHDYMVWRKKKESPLTPVIRSLFRTSGPY
jgi:hypothetical protein